MNRIVLLLGMKIDNSYRETQHNIYFIRQRFVNFQIYITNHEKGGKDEKVITG
jgi:hypothetical protein